MQQRYMRIEEVLELTGVTRSTIWRWQRKGSFPKLRQLGPGTVRFLRSEIVDWMESRPVVGGGGSEAGSVGVSADCPSARRL